MSFALHRIARRLLACASLGLLGATTGFAAPPEASRKPAAPPAAAETPAAPLRWDRLEPASLERASKASRAPAKTFPAERW